MELLCLAWGAVSPLGVDVVSTQAEMATRTMRFGETSVTDSEGEPQVASRLSLLPETASRGERLSALARGALAQVEPALDELRLDRVPLFLGLPAEGGAPFALSLLAASMDTVLPRRLELDRRRCFPAGRAGLMQALEAAQAHLARSAAPAALVGAVDSICDDESLRRLLLQQRLLTNRKDGTIPGEGAAFVLVTESASFWARRLPAARTSACRRLVSVALAQETQPIASGRSSTGAGLAEAIASVGREQRDDRRLDHVISCQTGEEYFAREFGIAYLRNAPLFPEPLAVEIMAQHVGDAGAAAPALGLIAADWLMGSGQRTDGMPQRALLLASSDGGAVGAVLIEAPTAPSLLHESLAQPVVQGATAGAASEGSSAVAGFQEELVEEHLEESGYRIYDREADLFYGGVTWREIEGAERAITRHLEALRLYGAQGRQWAAARLQDIDDDVVLGAVTFLASSHATEADQRALVEAAEGPDVDADGLDLWFRGLRWVMHPGLTHGVTRLACGQSLAAVEAVKLLGHSRCGDAPVLARLVSATDRERTLREAALRALAVVAPAQTVQPAMALAHAFPDSTAAAWALATAGHPAGLELARRALAQSQTPPPGMALLVAQAGEPRDAMALRRVLGDEQRRSEVCRALGILGLPDDVPLLLDCLGDGDAEVQAAAQEALVWLTGSDLVDPPPGTVAPRGEEQAVNPEQWRDYWNEQGQLFRRGQRYRRGEPFRLVACLDELEGTYPFAVRRRALDELRLRWRRPIALEPDWAVPRQRAVWAAVRQELEVTAGAETRR
jgi:3-oxoacyl-[acyl-carrier-protein] synthase-1